MHVVHPQLLPEQRCQVLGIRGLPTPGLPDDEARLGVVEAAGHLLEDAFGVWTVDDPTCSLSNRPPLQDLLLLLGAKSLGPTSTTTTSEL